MCSRHAIISTLWLLQNIVDRKIALKWRHARHRKNAIAIVGRNNGYKKRVWYKAEKRLLLHQIPSKNWWRLDKVSSWNYNSAHGVDHLSDTTPQAPLSIGGLEIWLEIVDNVWSRFHNSTLCPFSEQNGYRQKDQIVYHSYKEHWHPFRILRKRKEGEREPVCEKTEAFRMTF